MDTLPSSHIHLDGFISDLRATHTHVHPVATMQADLVQKQEIARLQSYQANFGFHVPFKMMHERQMLAGSRRLPGEKSSLLGLEIHMNNLENLNMEDYMNRTPPLSSLIEDLPLSHTVQPHTQFLKQ